MTSLNSISLLRITLEAQLGKSGHSNNICFNPMYGLDSFASEYVITSAANRKVNQKNSLTRTVLRHGCSIPSMSMDICLLAI